MPHSPPWMGRGSTQHPVVLLGGHVTAEAPVWSRRVGSQRRAPGLVSGLSLPHPQLLGWRWTLQGCGVATPCRITEDSTTFCPGSKGNGPSLP